MLYCRRWPCRYNVASIVTKTSPSPQTLRGLDGLNFFLADVQTGVGPFLAIYLAGYKWNEERVGLALMVGGIAGILMQTPAGGLVDSLRPKRALVGAAVAGHGRPSPDWRHLQCLHPSDLCDFTRSGRPCRL